MLNFKNIFISIFIVAAIIGVFLFATGSNKNAATDVSGSVAIWGTFNTDAMAPFIDDFNQANPKFHVTYVQKDPNTFASDITEAIAAGNPPDLVLAPENLIHRFKDKFFHIPFASLPADTFTNTFIDAANIFKVSDGYVAFPWAADPMIMYYNRDLLESIGVANPPKDWQTLDDMIPQLTKKSTDLTLNQSTVALGTYSNISHAKDILALLFMEAKNPFTTYDGTTFTAHFGGGGIPGELDTANQVMSFYTAFADPLKSVYSWNAGQKLDRDAFAQSSLVYYFGVASELPGIRAQNPNLNFMMALPPQASTSTLVTTGRIYGFSIPKTAKNQLLSYTVAAALVGVNAETSLSGKSAVTLSLIPTRRDVIANKQNSDPYLNFLYKAVLVQKSWYDPDPVATEQILSDMIRNINSATFSISGALSQAEGQMEAAAKKF